MSRRTCGDSVCLRAAETTGEIGLVARVPAQSAGSERTLVVVSSGWGPSSGGINAFNLDFCVAMGRLLQGTARVVCLTPPVPAEKTLEAATHGVHLVPLPNFDRNNAPKTAEGAAKALRDQGVQCIDLTFGHDVITGPVALELRGRLGGIGAVIHHMSYGSYQGMKTTGPDARVKEQEQQRVLRSADFVLAVGPLLEQSARHLCGGTCPITMLVPGLADIAPATDRGGMFRAIAFGRLGGEDNQIKQGRLAATGYGEFVRQAFQAGLPYTSHRFNVFGLSQEAFTREEEQLKRLVYEKANRVVNVVACPYTDDRSALFEALRCNEAAMMLSWHEGFGLVGWEAIAAGVPLIVSKASGLYSLLHDGPGISVSGCVTPVDVRGSPGDSLDECDIESVASALLKIAVDLKGAIARAAKLRESLRVTYTWENCARIALEACGWNEFTAKQTQLTTTAPTTPIKRDECGTGTSNIPGGSVSTEDTHHHDDSVVPQAFLPYRHNPFFSGRKRLLEDMHEKLQPRTAALVLTGLGGQGKTTVARAYVHEFGSDYRAVLWVNGDRDLLVEFQRLAEELGLVLPGSEAGSLGARQAKLELGSEIPRLLVIDNAPDEIAVHEWVPTKGACRTLITSRFDRWSAAFRPVKVDRFTEVEAREFLLKRLEKNNYENDIRGANKVAVALDYLPLALEHAAAYMLQRGSDWSGYLRDYDSAGIALLENEVLGSTQYPKSVTKTWLATVNCLSSIARAILRIISFLPSNGIPVELLTRSKDLINEAAVQLPPSTRDEGKLDAALCELTDYSMVTRNNDRLSVHRLVQAVEREAANQSANRQFWQGTVVDLLIKDGFPTREDYTSPWLEPSRFLCAVDFKILADVPEDKLGRLHLLVGNVHCRNLSNFDLALSHYDDGIRLCLPESQLQPAEAARIYRRRGDLYRLRREYTKAHESYQHARELLQTCNDESELGKLYSSLADYHIRAKSDLLDGDFEEALKAALASLALHRSTLARIEFDQAQPDQTELRGVRFEIFQSLRILADVHLARGNLDEAEKSLCEAEQRLESREHSHWGWVLRTKGDIHRFRRRYPEALECFTQALEHFRQRGIGTGIAIAQQKLGLVLFDRGRHDEAEGALAEALQTARGLRGAKGAVVEILSSLPESLRDRVLDKAGISFREYQEFTR